jgi:excisionase family DNA binding protein
MNVGVLYLLIDEAAEIARCSPVTIRRAIAAKRLTAVKPNGRMGRTLIRPNDLDRYMQRGTQLAIGEAAMTDSTTQANQS